MAAIKLRNNREHDITLHATIKGVVLAETIPSARQNPDDARLPIPGEGVIDSAFFVEACKSPAVKGMVEEKWLEQVTE